MLSRDEVVARIEESIRVHRALSEQAELLRSMAGEWTAAIRRGNQILFFGNGGSAADAQHWACELSGRFYLDRRPVPAQALTVNSSNLTAIANDYGYDEVFARQLEGVGRSGDVAVGISTSGNSVSVIKALRSARALGMITMGFTGRTGGEMRALVDHWLGIDSTDTPRIQEGHELAGHLICELTERELFESETVEGKPGRS